jgi:hypothetical protein
MTRTHTLHYTTTTPRYLGACGEEFLADVQLDEHTAHAPDVHPVGPVSTAQHHLEAAVPVCVCGICG